MTRMRAFTLIELLVVVAVVATLIAIVIPGLAAARTRARTLLCGARLQQLTVATSLYLNDHDNALPQMRTPLAYGGEEINGTLFGGKKGTLPLFGTDQFGAERRPLNPYVRAEAVPPDDADTPFELEPFRSPMDQGARETYLPLVQFQSTDSMYEMLGTSYAINDHGLDGDWQKTLIPSTGGCMPFVLDPTRTWLLASHTIYNYQQDSDRGMRWYDPKRTQANIAFVDGHVRLTVAVPDELCVVENTTPDYTFFPVPEPRR